MPKLPANGRRMYFANPDATAIFATLQGDTSPKHVLLTICWLWYICFQAVNFKPTSNLWKIKPTTKNLKYRTAYMSGHGKSCLGNQMITLLCGDAKIKVSHCLHMSVDPHEYIKLMQIDSKTNLLPDPLGFSTCRGWSHLTQTGCTVGKHRGMFKDLSRLVSVWQNFRSGHKEE